MFRYGLMKKKTVVKKYVVFLLMLFLGFSLTYTNPITASAAGKASYKITTYRQTKNYKKLNAEYSYQLPQLKGAGKAMAHIPLL